MHEQFPVEPPAVAAAFQEAVRVHGQGGAAQADALCADILRMQPDHFNALHLRGLLAFEQGEDAAGFDFIERSLAINPNQASAYSNRGNRLMELERFAEALSNFDTALRVKPDHVLALYNRGNALCALRRCTEAVESYSKALQFAPNCLPALNRRTRLLLELNHAAEALAGADEMVRLDASNFDAQFNRGEALFKLQRLGEALAAYDEAMRLNPGSVAARLNRADALHALGRTADALQGPRIAVVRLDNLGDHVLGSGLLRALREIYPHSRVTLVAQEAIADLYARCPYVEHVVGLPATYLHSTRHFKAELEKLSAIHKFDIVINPRFAEDYYGAGLMSKELGAPGARVIGFRQASSPIPNYEPNSFFSELVDASDERHVATYAQVLLDSLSPAHSRASPELWFTESDRERIQAHHALDRGQYVVLGCGASFPFKRPSRDVYRHIVHELVARWGLKVVLVGTAEERPLAESLMAIGPERSEIVSTVGELRLFELGALLGDARLYVGPDAGPMHMAAAAGTKVIEIGWVPEDYPAKSRGTLSAGKCWAPWSERSVSVRPLGSVFYAGTRRAGWADRTIEGISFEQINGALASMLAV